MRASAKAISYDDIFHLNFNYYKVGAKKDPRSLDNINYYINPLLGAVLKLRFDNSTGYMKKWLNDNRHSHPDIVQIVFDYLYNNTKRWKKLQLVIPTVSLSREMIEKLHLEPTFVDSLKKAVLDDDLNEGRRLHKILMKALMDVEGLKFNYRLRHTKGKSYPINYLHIIAEPHDEAETGTETKDKSKKTVDLNRLFGDPSWEPENLLFDAVIDGI